MHRSIRAALTIALAIAATLAPTTAAHAYPNAHTDGSSTHSWGAPDYGTDTLEWGHLTNYVPGFNEIYAIQIVGANYGTYPSQWPSPNPSNKVGVWITIQTMDLDGTVYDCGTSANVGNAAGSYSATVTFEHECDQTNCAPTCTGNYDTVRRPWRVHTRAQWMPLVGGVRTWQYQYTNTAWLDSGGGTY